MRRKLAIGGVVLALCFGVVITRAIIEGRSALSKGDSAHVSGDPDGAIRWWRRAARWYVPAAPHVARAYSRLEALANAAEVAAKAAKSPAEARGHRRVALTAWRGIRGSILSTRSFYTPFSAKLDPANQHISRLMALQEGDKAADNVLTKRAEWHYQQLGRDDAPSVFWSVIALLGFATWLGGGVLFALRGITADDKLVVRSAGRAGLLVAGGLVVWMLGLYSA